MVFALPIAAIFWNFPALAAMTGRIGAKIKAHGSLAKVPAAAVSNVRDDMYSPPRRSAFSTSPRQSSSMPTPAQT